MNAISLSLDRLIQGAWEHRRVIEQRLMLGALWLASRRLFDDRHRLRLDRLRTPKGSRSERRR